MEMEHYLIPELNDGSRVFVFGSNLAGRHGKGAALTARLHWGALTGAGRGRQGMAYAIPTKNENLAPRDLYLIGQDIQEFLAYARKHPEITFLVTKIGCGLAGFRPCQMSPFFTGSPSNCILPPLWGDPLSISFLNE